MTWAKTRCPGHVADGLRVDDDFFEARAVRCVLDSGEVVVKPFLNLAEHEMILATRHARRSHASVKLVAPIFKLHSVAGFVRLVVDVKNHVAAPAAGQRAEQIAVADVAGRQRVAALAHIGDNGIKHRVAIGGSQMPMTSGMEFAVCEPVA
jgi:hypothetical protein